MNVKALGRFKFTIKDEIDFNCEIIIDIMHISGKTVLYVFDTATGFQAAQFFKDFSTKLVWKSLCICWINVYLRPPGIIVHGSET